MGEGSSEAIDRSTMSREEKLAVDSAEAGYRLAHTLSESWGDEHMPKTPVEDAEVTESPEPHEPLEVPSLQTQRTLLDEELDGAASDACCVIDSSPEESSKPSALSRRPHISKSWNSALSPKLTKEQKARFLEACRAKMTAIAPPAASTTALTSTWGVSKRVSGL